MKSSYDNSDVTATSKIANKIFRELEKENKPLKIEDIMEGVGLSIRTVRYGLKVLLEANKITKIPNFQDLRSCFYVNNIPNNSL